MKNLQSLREEYTAMTLDEKEVDPNPLRQFVLWFDQATQAGLPEPNAMTLATADSKGRPSARIVLLKEVDEAGFIFFTNYHSQKGSQLEENPYASIVFNWLELQRQVRIAGRVEKLPSDQSDAYFAQRPRPSQLGAVVSPQSHPLPNREILDILYKEAERKFHNLPIPRPEQWGGYRLIPHSLEFWQGRASRLHDRIIYTCVENGSWELCRLAP